MNEREDNIGGQLDALTLLRDDHTILKNLFQQFEQAQDSYTKQIIVGNTCAELKVHAKIEEEIFYPVVRDAIGNDEIVDEAVVDHQIAKDFVSELEAMEPDDVDYDATFRALCDGVKHHIEEEESELFAEVKSTDLDLYALGAEMAQRQEELWEELPQHVLKRRGDDAPRRPLNYGL